MKVISIFSTKGGPGKTTKTVNLAAFCADGHKKTLIIDGDYAQPSATSYYDLTYEAPYGLYELLTKSADFTRENFICHTVIPNLDLIKSNDPKGRLVIELLHAPDGRLRLNTALKQPMFADYDVIIIDTQGARSIVSEVVILASDIIFCITKPILPDVREFLRGTIPIFEDLLTFSAFGIEIPQIKLLVNCMDYSINAKETVASLQEIITAHAYSNMPEIKMELLTTVVHDLQIYKQGHRVGLPAHRLEQVTRRKSASAMQTMTDIACELLPEWQADFKKIQQHKGGW